jgi:hypothetical protein
MVGAPTVVRRFACSGGAFDPCEAEVARADSSMFFSLSTRVCFSFIVAQIPM